MIRVYKASKGQPKHREIFDEIKKEVDNGEWKEDRAIPTERGLAEHFLSSRAITRRAIESLKRRGYLYSAHGQGTLTLSARGREDHLLYSFTDNTKVRGSIPAQNTLGIGYIPLSDIIRKNLELDIHVHTVFHIRRIRYVGSTPLGVQASWPTLNDGQEMTQEELLATGSLYILLEEKLATKPLEAAEIISVRPPSPLERQLLELTIDDVMLSCTRVTLSVERKSVEYIEMVYPASRYSYRVWIIGDNFSV